MKKFFGLLVFLISEFLLALPVFAFFHETLETKNFLTFLFKDIFGFVDFATTLNFFLFDFILPLAAIIIVVAAFLKELRIFGRAKNYQWALAIIIGLFTLPTKWLAAFVKITSAAIGVLAWFVFVALFFVGTFFYIGIRGRGWHREYTVEATATYAAQELERELRRIRQEQMDLTDALKTGKITSDQFNAKMGALDRERASALDRIKALRERA